MRSFAALSKQQTEKDYYSILDIPSHATPEQVKEAYRTLAKKHHPDVRSSKDEAALYDPDVEKFRDVVEAYGVLSGPESRAAFDISRRKNPKLYQSYGEQEFDMSASRDKRGVSSAKKSPVRGSYAE